MAPREPSWWYGDGASPWLACALEPVARVYGALAARRLARTPQTRATIPVLCVGNFTAGGTGKTPMVRTVLGLLREAGHRPVVLSRGYGGRVRGPHRVDRACDRALDVGDEPLLLAAYAPVVVARDRGAGARFIARDTPLAATVIVMDDGLQNPALAKDLCLAVVDGARGFGNGRCIPAGPLRAPLAAQLKMVDAVVINNGSAAVPGEHLAWRDALKPPLLNARIEPVGAVGTLHDKPVVAYAGIGVPERFFASLRASGATIAAAVPFPDHYDYTDADAARLIATAVNHGAILVTTEKDAARLAGATGPRGDLARLSRTLPIRLDLDAAGVALLRRLIAERLPLRA